jgi:hypothetical protein
VPELLAKPDNPTWPPAGAAGAGVTVHVVANKDGRVEGLLDIANNYALAFEDLIEFNFSLKSNEQNYFRKINWYLKFMLRCTKTTSKGNFMFSGGEKIYVPPSKVLMPGASVTVPRPSQNDTPPVLGLLFSTASSSAPAIPGVDETSEAPNSPLPGQSGGRANQAEAIAALVQGLSTLITGKAAGYSTKLRIEQFVKNSGIDRHIVPSGGYAGYVVAVSRYVYAEQPDFPPLPQQVYFVCYANNVHEAEMFAKSWVAGFDRNNLVEPPPTGATRAFDFYWGTRNP